MATETLQNILAHAESGDMYLSNELSHYGVKGMRWGFRRPVGSDGLVKRGILDENGHTTRDFIYDSKTGHLHEVNADGSKGKIAATKQELGGKRPTTSSVHTKGGLDGNPNTSADHERAVKALAKANERGTSSLSNEELKAIKNRLQAEKEFHQLTTDQKSELQKKVDELRLMQDYRKLSAADREARKSAGRKILDAIIAEAADQAKGQAKDLLLGKEDKPGLIDELIKKSKDRRSKAKSGGFKVNPNSVTITPTPIHNLPVLLRQN